MSGVGGRPVVFIRFNPDVTRHGGKALPLKLGDKVDLLIATIKAELDREHDRFGVTLVQLYYDDPSRSTAAYAPKRAEDITGAVCV